MTSLARSQISAATAIKSKLPLWSAADQGLIWLGKNHEGFAIHSCLLKTAAINSLYATGIRDIYRLPEHVGRTLSTSEHFNWIEKKSRLPTEETRARAIKLVSDLAEFRLDSGKTLKAVSFSSSFVTSLLIQNVSLSTTAQPEKPLPCTTSLATDLQARPTKHSATRFIGFAASLSIQ
jgi:hypothetical protein